ncbi:MAG: peptidoglycan-binding protein [Cyanobacteria bacterium P01_E01_bin.6]
MTLLPEKTKPIHTVSWIRNFSRIAACLPLLLFTTAMPMAIAQTVQAPTSASQSTPPSAARPLLRLGSEGTDVADIQSMLTLLGFYRGPIDGKFGDTTTVSVATFQQAAGLTVDGIVGDSTWNRLLPSANRVDTAPPTESSQPSSSPATSQNTTDIRSVNTTDTTRQNSEPNASADEPTSTEAIPYVEFPVLRRGMRGAAVIGLQERLRTVGVYRGPVDGIFGTQTESAVISAQRQFNLTPDGVVGAATWDAIIQ